MKRNAERSRKSRVRIIGPGGTPDRDAIQSFFHDCVIPVLGEEFLSQRRTRHAASEVTAGDLTLGALRRRAAVVAVGHHERS